MDEGRAKRAGQRMNINIPDQLASGVIVVLAVIAMGAFIAFLLRGIARKFPFTCMALVLALAPLSLINFLGYNQSTALLIYAMIATLLGFALDGISHLLMPEAQSRPASNSADPEKETGETKPGAIVWEKAE